MGTVANDSPLAASGAYRLTGITRVGDEIPIRKILDRGWPDYAYPSSHENETVRNYRAFVKWQQQNNGLAPSVSAPGGTIRSCW